MAATRPRLPIDPQWHHLYGAVSSPANAADALSLIAELSLEGVDAWRGQPDARDPIEPTIVRRWQLSTGAPRGARPGESEVQRLESALIERARRVGHDTDLSELELLARLRHHGAATRLLDATRNAFVALWFACRQQQDTAGILIGFGLRDSNDAIEVTTEMVKLSLREVLDVADGRLLWWQPRDVTPRIVTQHALIVLGTTDQILRASALRFAPVDSDPIVSPSGNEFGSLGGAACILITPQLKRTLNTMWSSVFGFTDEVMFPDFDGFAHAHRETTEYPIDFGVTRSPRPVGAATDGRLADVSSYEYSWDLPKHTTRSESLDQLDIAALTAGLADDIAVEQATVDAATGDAVIPALTRLIRSLERNADFARAVTVADQLLEVTGEGPSQAAALILSGGIQARSGDIERATEFVDRAIRVAEARADHAHLSLGLVQHAVLRIPADPQGALTTLDRAFRLARDHQLTAAKGYALAAVGCVYLDQKDDRAASLLNRAQLLYERAEDLPSLGRTHNNVGILNHLSGRFVNAIPVYERALDLAATSRDLVTMITVLNNNLRAVESHYLNREATLRQIIEELRDGMADPEIKRYADLTTLRRPFGERRPSTDTFVETDVYAPDPVILLPTPHSGVLRWLPDQVIA